MTATIIGIDPGKPTGIAILRGGALVELRTVAMAGVFDVVMPLLQEIPLVVFEDSRKNTVYPRPGQNPRAMLRIARSVGHVDLQSREIEAMCKSRGIECIGVSPQRKGAKLNAERFAEITGWTKRSNQHERDAAMVAWPYRRMK